MARRVWFAAVGLVLMAVAAGAQAPSSSPPAQAQPQAQQQAQQQAPPQGQQAQPEAPVGMERRPATTTFFGDTGLWFVPTAEILPHGLFSASGYRAGFNTQQGFSNIAHIAATFGAGVRDRVEIFGSWRLDTRIDRDIRPLFTADQRSGAFVNDKPYVREGWTGDNLGDLFVGAKLNLLSEYRQQPMAFAVRGMVKLPTGDEEAGVSTGAADFYVDGIASKEIGRMVDLSGFAGFAWRGQPDDPVTIDVSSAFRWGVGVALPSRSPLRVVGELHGEILSDTIDASAPLVAVDGSLSPTLSDIRNLHQATVGLVYQHRSGFFAGAGLNWSFPTDSRSDFGFGDVTGDYVDVQFRLGYHPGARIYVPPPPPPPPPPAPPANQNPTVKAACDPCTVEIGKSSTVTAEGRDPDGDTLTYRWSAPTGTFAAPGDQKTVWTAPDQEGTVPVTVTVNDGRGGTASDTVNIQVVRPPRKEYVFEDVHFDFDRYTLRPDATRMLDEAIAAMKEDPQLRIQIEGHTCNIGTAEYNLALGERRAGAVRDYLVSRGVPADRLGTVSYGEERPKHDNNREETRRLNRRAALVVKVQ